MSSKTDKSTSRPRGGRLARRARSFKEDFFGKISQIRVPVGHRSSSPQKGHSHENGKSHKGLNAFIEAKSDHPEKGVERVEHFMNQLKKSLTYLKDVIHKDKLEMLPGSTTVALEMVTEIQSSLRTCSPTVTEQSPQVKAATIQVFQSLAALMRWADEVSIFQSTNENKGNVEEVSSAVLEAVEVLVDLSLDKNQAKEIKPGAQMNTAINSTSLHNGLCSPKPERTSLPDIPLTPREKEILEQTVFPTDPAEYSPIHPHPVQTENGRSCPHSILHHSTSSDSILSPVTGTKPPVGNGFVLTAIIPPPKPPLPNDRVSSKTSHSSKSNAAPPLPPKKRSGTGNGFLSTQCQSVTTSGFFAGLNSCHSSIAPDGFLHGHRPNPSFDWMVENPSSISPQDSVDSNLNHSADDLLLIKKTSNSIFQHRTRFQNESSTNTMNGRTAVAMDQGSKTISYSSTSYSSKKMTQVTSYKSQFGGSSLENILSDVKGSMSSAHIQKKEVSLSINGTEQLKSPSWPPPALPVKQRTSGNRTFSQYDNVPAVCLSDNEPISLTESNKMSHNGHSLLEVDGSHCGHLTHSQSMIYYPGGGCLPTSLSTANNLCCPGHLQSQQRERYAGSCSLLDDCKPPPLPPKKRHIMAYMQTFGSYSQPAEGEFFRHSLHTYQVVAAKWQQEETSFQIGSTSNSTEVSNISIVSSSDDSVFSESRSSQDSWEQFAMVDDDSSRPGSSPRFPALSNSPSSLLPVTPPALPPKKNRVSSGSNKQPEITSLIQPVEELLVVNTKPAKPTTPVTESPQQWSKESQELVEQGPLDELEVQNHLVLKKTEEDGPDVRGGSVDALIVFATKAAKNDFYYQEAFLTTYRTFVSPYNLVQKLLYRYNRFIHLSDMRQRAARNAFSLLVRVVDDLCVGDLDQNMLRVLLDFIHQLVSHGDLILAKALRKKVVEKCDAKKVDEQVKAAPISHSMSTHQALLIDFKSEHLAEQMTMLDANLFQKIEIPELLLWAQEQKEDLSPNLTKFTEHFNKMSYWARSRILDREDAKDRERYVIKFIKIMKHLRKLNNFNSYLAILSALDSAPIRRLEWQRTITEGLKEYCALIDSSSSFRAYRQALAETEPPCIPYIGLILQDLTFVHIGNNDLLPEGNVNFAKRWQQCNILENMKRFHNCQYMFKKDEATLAFFNNFDQYLCEEAMWQISESIKPRGGAALKKKQEN